MSRAQLALNVDDLDEAIGPPRRPGLRRTDRHRCRESWMPSLAQRMHASGESSGTIGSTLGVSRATAQRALGGDDATTS
jgi:hypothetical protein